MVCKSVKIKSGLSRQTVFALAVLASTAWTPIAVANEYQAVIPLSSLDGTNGFRLDGAAAGDTDRGDQRGASVSSAGDVNGDGFADLIVGAPFADPHGATSGSSYVVFGKAGGFAASLDLASLNGANGFRLDGQFYDLGGWSVASAGDVNGDGFSDVLIAAPWTDFAGFNAGSSYVIFGKASGFPAVLDLATVNGANGFRLDRGGNSVGSAGDINGDGFDDIIIESYGDGSSYVVFGKASGFSAHLDLASLNGSNGFRLSQNGVVASAGDINGDGFDDVILGIPSADFHGTDSGSSYVVFGKASGFPATINLSSLDGTNGFRLDGVASGDHAGNSVHSAGDFNGDGFADLIIAAPDADPQGQSSGSTYVVFGRASGFPAIFDLASLNGANGFRLDGVAAGDQLGCVFTQECNVASAGDVNVDGFSDVIISAASADPHGAESGSAYVVFGKGTSFPDVIKLSSLNGEKGFRLDGEAAGDRCAWSVAGAGDVNGDGLADLLIGSPDADPHGSNSGARYVVFGRLPDSARTRVGSAADQYISGGPFDDTLKGQDGADRLEGRGGADRLMGGLNKDAASYLHSPTGVTASLANPGSNTGDAAGDSYSSIKNLIGSRFADTLTGNGFSNSLTGDEAPDVLTGQGGPDLFVYNHLRDSPPAAGRDQITDFDAGTGTTSVDKIDLRAIDAKAGPGNQAFRFIGTVPFSNTKGELRVQQTGTSAVIQGDVDGDGTADLEIELLNFTDLSTLTAIDFRL